MVVSFIATSKHSNFHPIQPWRPNIQQSHILPATDIFTNTVQFFLIPRNHSLFAYLPSASESVASYQVHTHQLLHRQPQFFCTWSWSTYISLSLLVTDLLDNFAEFLVANLESLGEVSVVFFKLTLDALCDFLLVVLLLFYQFFLDASESVTYFFHWLPWRRLFFGSFLTPNS